VTTYEFYGLGLLHEETNGAAKYYHFDHVGNTLALTDTSQNVTDTWTYASFGSVISRTGGTDTPFQMNGAVGVQTDGNGLYHMRNRYYNPRIMRFLNRDPIAEAGGLNLYGFAGNDAVNGVDYMGYSWLSHLWNNSVGWLGKHIAQNWDHARPYIAAVGAIVASVVTAVFAPELLPAMSPFWTAVSTGAAAGFAGSFTGAVLSGQGLGSSLKAGLIGGALGGALGGIGYEMFGPATPVMGKLASADHTFVFNVMAHYNAAMAAAMHGATTAGMVGGVLGTGLTVGEFISAAGSGAAHGLYNATVGAARSAFNSGVNHMAASAIAFGEGDYTMSVLHATAMAGDVAGLALTAAGAGELTVAGGRLAASAFTEIAENGVGSFARSAGRFFYDNRTFNAVRQQYWRANGPANGQSLHHWLFPQRATGIAQGVRNAGFNLMEMPGRLNSWMGYAARAGGAEGWAATAVEWGIKAAVPGSFVGSAYLGAELGSEP